MPTEWRDLLWFLLPVAAASGWFAARRITTNPGRVVSAEYRRGVSYLLNEQPDRAIEIFTRLMDADVDTIEIHLALGSVFRRRGEVERAIRIHQGLVSGSALDPAQRSHALCELALDYQKAGLLDRAETLFEELTQIPEHTDQALRSLVHIYEQEKDWDKVSVVARRLMSVSGTEQYGLLAQYQCEMAEVALNRNDFTSADRFMREALALDPRCVRAHHLAGQAAAAQGDDRRAIAAWQEIEYLDPAFLDEVVHYIDLAFRRLDDLAGLQMYLEGLMARHAGVNTLTCLAEVMRINAGLEETRRYISEQVRIHPSVNGTGKLMELFLESGLPANHEEMVLLKDSLLQLLELQKGYLCDHCGFQSRAHLWQCPACFDWLAMHPVNCFGPGKAQPGDGAGPTVPAYSQKSGHP